MLSSPQTSSETTVADGRSIASPASSGPIRLLKIARVRSRLTGMEGIIVTRQLSSHFARFDSYLPLLVGEAVEIDFDDTGGVAGVVTEKLLNSYTLQFTDPFDPVQRLRSDHEPTGSKMRRRPRVAIGVSATLHGKGAKYSGRIVDLSVGGAKIAVDEPIAVSGEVQIRSWGRTPITASIAWQANGEIGVIFVRKLSIPELLSWSA